MTTILVSVAAMLIIFAAMAVGVIFSNKPIKGTCGGLNQFREGDCEICGGNPDKCESSESFDAPAEADEALAQQTIAGQTRAEQAKPIAYDVMGNLNKKS